MADKLYSGGRQLDLGISLGIDTITGLLYVFVDGVRKGTGIDIGAEGMDVSDVVSFYQNDVKSAAQYVNDLGTDYVHFILATDQHYSYNYGYTPNIMKCLFATGLFEKIIFLGDNADDSGGTTQTAWETAHHDIIPDSLIILGNHETATGDQTRLGEIYTYWRENIMSRLKANVVYGTTGQYGTEYCMYYYYDIPDYKIRIICLDADSGKEGEREWLESVIASVPSDWTYFVFSHEYQDNLTNLFGTYTAKNILSANWGVYTALDNRFGALFCGHHHNDICNFHYGFLHNDTFLTDSYKSAGGTNGGTPMPTRSNADNTAQAITIISINPTTKNVKFYRIGQTDTSTVEWVDKKREYTYGGRLPVVMENTWAGSGGVFQEVEGAKLWMKPQEVDAAKTYYIYHEDGTDLKTRSNYLMFEYDAGGKFLGRSNYNTVVSSKVQRASLRSTTKYVIKSSYYGDEFVLADVNPYE